jgi:hypothetical protein
MGLSTSQGDSPFSAPSGIWIRVDQWVERGGERLNPILIKEARQALKSRQFLITFTLLLVCGWIWSLIGIAILGPGVYYSPGGPFMLTGYFFVLTVPLLLIVPFSAYRSLAAEREDGTYELLSITTLSSRQIVGGKLGSAVLQMLIYYSALSPCIAFTYLLRGVDVFTIGFALFYTFLASLLLSALGLTTAAMTRFRHIQLLLSVILLIGLVLATVVWCIYFTALSYEIGSVPYDSVEFWLGNAALLTFYASYFVLFVLAAGALLSFASDNRSTKLRIVMLVQQVLLVAWMMYFWLQSRDDDVLYAMLSFSAVHWMVMGSLMTGELAPLSPRVKRQLPQSVLGRVLLTWFNPGSGTGYVFAVGNLFAVAILAAIAGFVAQAQGFSGAPRDLNLITFGALASGYVAGYLGAARLLVLLLDRWLTFGLLLPFLLNVALALVGLALPLFVQAWIWGLSDFNEYTPLQITNWFWTLGEAARGTFALTLTVPILVLVAAVALFLVNLLLARREIEQVRQETPVRVQREERELHPERFPQVPKPTSPFDD